MRVLVVEDHLVLANRIGEGLRDAGFAADVVYDGAAALQSTTRTDYDVVVLDRDLPTVHGDRVCRQLVRNGSPSRILMLRGRSLVRTEWRLAMLTHNLRKLHRHQLAIAPG